MKTGVQKDFNSTILLDSDFRRNDGKRAFSTFYESITITSKSIYMFNIILSNPNSQGSIKKAHNIGFQPEINPLQLGVFNY